MKAILIDGNSLAYRAFYALPDTMKTSDGIVSNAIYGFTSMLLKILEEEPDYVAISFDLKEPTFRHKKYKEYKATRDKAPPTLHQQMPHIKEVAKALNIPIFEMPGFEADDVIGTLAQEAEKEGYKVELFSGDKDLLQLVNKNIKLVTPRKGMSDLMVYDEKAIVEKYSLKATQMIDLKALKGDSSDNIPGVRGIGEKTAVSLLKEFGSLDNLLKNTAKIKKDRIRTLIETEKEQALLSYMLGTIVCDVPIEIIIKKEKKYAIDWDKAIKIFEKFEFNHLIKKYSDKKHSKQTLEEKRKEISKYDFHCVDSEKKLKELIKKLEEADSFAFDTETDSVKALDANLVGISFSIKHGEAFYLPITNYKLLVTNFKSILESNKLKSGHNIKYDIEVLLKYGINVAPPYFDTMVAAYLLDPNSNQLNLKMTAARYLGRHEMTKMDELIGKGGEYETFADVPIDLATQYACSDADVTIGLADKFNNLLKEEKLDKLFYEVEMPLISALVELEKNGVYVDSKILNKISKELEHEIKDLERNIFAIAGEKFNLNSPKQLREILFVKLMLPVIKKTKTGASTDASVLEELAVKYEIAQKLLEYRQYSKIKSTYVDVLPTLVRKDTGRIHANFNQTITATGRLSSSNPNMQNIPIRGKLGKKVRSAFVPQKKGYKILVADYSQVELRILAHLSQDKQLIKDFKDGKDIHRATAADIFGITENFVDDEQRSAAKAINFGIIYGQSAFGLSKSLKISRKEAEQFIERYFKRYKGVKKFMEKTIKEAKKNGYVETMLGRKRPLPDINSPNFSLKAFAERTAINTPVQGTAADLIKVAMTKINSQLTTNNLQLILQVHDELVLEVKEAELDKVKKIVKHEMENAIPLDVKAKVDIGVGDSWSEAK